MWSPVHTESKPSCSTRCTSASCSSGGCMESCAPNPVMPSPRKRVLDAAVHRERAAGRLRRPVGGEEEHRLGDVLGEDPDTEKGALAGKILELGDRDPLGGRALAPDLLGPELRVPEAGVWLHDDSADPAGRTLERPDHREPRSGRLRTDVR